MTQHSGARIGKPLLLFWVMLLLPSCRSITLSQSVSINLVPPQTSSLNLLIECRLLGAFIARPFEPPFSIRAGCFGFTSASENADVHSFERLPVFLQTETYTCGPVALAEVLSYWGRSENPDLLSQYLGASERKGVSVVDMAAYPRRLGFWVETGVAHSPNELRKWIKQGFPVILLVDSGIGFLSVGHYIVVVGFDEEAKRFLALTGSGKEALDCSLLDYVWCKKGRWFEVVIPPEKVTWAVSPGQVLDLGLCFERSGNLEKAADCYKEILRRETDRRILSKAHNNLGNICSAQGDREKAEKHYSRALAYQPQNAQSLNSLAYIYALRGENLEQAERLVKKALELEPRFSGIFLDTLGVVLLAQNRTDEAIEVLQKAVGQIPLGERKFLALAYLHLGEALLARCDRKSDAVLALSLAIRISPEYEDCKGAQEHANCALRPEESK